MNVPQITANISVAPYCMTSFRHVEQYIGSYKVLCIAEEEKRLRQINDYALMNTISAGDNSKVYDVVDTKTGTGYIAKTVYVTNSNKDACEREKKLLQSFDHKNIVKLHEVLCVDYKAMACFILERAPFGSLKGLIGKKLGEATVASIFRQVCLGLSYLHDKGFCHNDVKPANVLLFDRGVAKICDFGSCEKIGEDKELMRSPAYQAPELVAVEIECELDGAKQDVWSLGVSMFELMFGYLPYRGSNVYEIAYEIMSTKLKIPETASEDFRDLLEGMLKMNPGDRMSMSEVMKHEFFDAACSEIVLPLDRWEVPRVPRMEVDQMCANVCGEEFTFMSVKRSHSWSHAPRHRL